MKKLLSALKWIDDNLIHIFLIGFIILTSLMPKYPLIHVNYTYIKIRVDDFIIVAMGIVFLLQLARRKVRLRTAFLPHVLIFWGAVFLSYFWGAYIQNTVAVKNLGLLHSLRRVQYMAIFFIASSVVTSEKRFMKYMAVYLGTLFVVCLYGFGQKFLAFPSIQSMNAAYVDGQLLTLNPEDRVNSTFGGHFDLAAYLVFSIPLILGYFFYQGKKKFFALFILALTVMLYTAARSSFLAYLVVITLFLLYLRRFKLYILVIILTAGLLWVTGDTTRRFQQTFQFKTVFVNNQTGATVIDQKVSAKKLAAGDLKIPLATKKTQKVKGDIEKINKIALEQAAAEAIKKGDKSTEAQLNKRAREIASNFTPQKMLLCDISCATRLQLEWPRAIAAFEINPILGTGPSSLGEATDNNILRLFGEFGIIGGLSFSYLLFSITRFVWKKARKTDGNTRYILFGFVFAVISLIINALYVDLFEASKMAYNLWLLSGLFVGYIATVNKEKSTS